LYSTSNIKYNSSLSAGGILFHEFLALKELILSSDFEVALKAELDNNLLVGIKTLGARKRVLRELKRRVNEMPHSFWQQFYQWTEREQRLALLYVCLKTYRLVFDIHWEHTLKKFKTSAQLDALGISMFFDELASRDDLFASWSPSTLNKINTQYRKALKDAGLLESNSLKKPREISDAFWQYFVDNDEAWWLEACFIT
jgi:hypothetical protein